jgi:peptidoglycan/LPS O-acetylase OafA/YrhL
VKVKVELKALRLSKWYEYLIRFFFGGAITAIAGIIAKRWGPEIGGLFLAFPAILPAAATLLESNEKKKKRQAGKEGSQRGRAAAGVDAAGAAMGSIGLLAFAYVVWKFMPRGSIAIVLGAATVVWFAFALLTWELHETLYRKLRVKYLSRRHPQHTRVHAASGSIKPRERKTGN